MVGFLELQQNQPMNTIKKKKKQYSKFWRPQKNNNKKKWQQLKDT